MAELQRADLQRSRAAYERTRPNTPERVPTNQLQLAFERVLLALWDVPAANEVTAGQVESAFQQDDCEGAPKKRRGPRGRRRLDPELFSGFKGHLLADGAPVYDVLFREGEVFEVACWFHLRRASSRSDVPHQQALPGGKACAAARTTREDFGAWVARHRASADPRGRLEGAIGYYLNQREALHRFLVDGRLRLDNSISEQQLRKVILGRHNWPTPRVLELSPKYWKSTLENLNPWERTWSTVPATAPPRLATGS